MVDLDAAAALLSSLLGSAIVAGSAILKVPQIVQIVKNRSVEGISRFATEVEGFCLLVQLAYFLRAPEILPFTAWGEVAFIAVQAQILVVLLHVLAKPPATLRLLTIIAPLYAGLVAVLSTPIVNYTMLTALYNLQTTLLIGSRVPQIMKNFQSGSTGQLSFATTFLTFGGGAARVFTSWQSGAPWSVLIGFILGTITSFTVTAQILYYSYFKKAKAE